MYKFATSRLARLARVLAIPVLALAFIGFPGNGRAADVTVFAAASLKNALDLVITNYQQETAKSVVASYAASSALAKQIMDGAPADIFISADLDWMDKVVEKDLIASDTRINLLGNQLVLVAAAGSPLTAEITPDLDLAGLLGDGRLALGEVKSVPAGKYAKAALENLGLWDQVSDRLAEGENVRAALALVARGEVPLAIVYATDARAEPAVRVVATFPEGSHPPIIYPAANVKGAASADAEGFLDYMKGQAGREIFEKAGFRFLPGAPN